MDRKTVNSKVKQSLSQFGLTEVQLQVFENIIVGELEGLDKDADREEYVTERLAKADFLQIAQTMQASSTKLHQDIAKKAKELEELKKQQEETLAKLKELEGKQGGDDDDDKNPPKPDNMDEFQKKMFEQLQKSQETQEALLKRIESMEESSKIETVKATILSEAKTKYADSVIETAIENFDFTMEDASDKFNEECSKISTRFGVSLKISNDPPKENEVSKEVKSFLEGRAEERKRKDELNEKFKGMLR